jgi:mycobactin peptide synthetase MbtE
VSRQNPTSVDKRGLIDRVYLHAAVRASRAALDCGDRTITYGMLGQQLSARVSALTELVRPGDLVALERRRSAEFVVDFLAVLALDGIPVPLDPELPAQRRERLMELVDPAVVLRDYTMLLRSPAPPVPVSDGGYVFFTSGSTGAPKPVLGSAAALRSFLEWHCAEFGIGPDDRVAFLTALSFDVMVRDMFVPLWAGATLVIPSPKESSSPEATVAWLDEQDISVVNVVPSVAASWLRHGHRRCEAMRKVFFAGEPLTAGVVAQWHEMFPATRVRVNYYGTTETTLPKVYQRVRPDDDTSGALPAGTPLPGTRFCLIEPTDPFDATVIRDALAEPRLAGEVVLISRYSSHGYLRRPEETEARFVDLGDGEVAYRTGDRAWVNQLGELVVTGRVDEELKIYGVRIHPAEVQAAIRAAEPVAEVFVTGTPALTAYLVPAEGSELDLPGLRHQLTESLPPAMIPTRFVQLHELPRLPNGKVDRTALRPPTEADVPRELFVEPSGDTERWLARQWAKLFSTARVSAIDDFFALGGDSILAMQLAARINRDFGVTVSVRTIFAKPTLASLAAEITDLQLMSVEADELLALLERVEVAPPGRGTA